MKIYLAGPDVFAQDPIAKGAELKALCKRYGAEGLFPLDNEISDTEQGSIEQARAIRGANMTLIERGADGHLRDEQHMSVEEFRSGGIGLVDNLMISCGIEKLCKTAEEAIQETVSTFKTRSMAK